MKRWLAITTARAAMLLAVVAWCSGCGTAQHPESALESYVESVRAKDTDAVWAMLGDELRGEMSRDDFATFFAQNYDEILAQAETIEAAVEDERIEIVAALPIDGHSEISLEYASQDWQLVDDVPAVAGASSPRGTLAALSDALDTRDLDALLLLLSRQKSDTLNAELGILRSSLSGVEEDDIIVNGDSATVYLDYGLKLELIFEDGAWRMDRLDQQP